MLVAETEYVKLDRIAPSGIVNVGPNVVTLTGRFGGGQFDDAHVAVTLCVQIPLGRPSSTHGPMEPVIVWLVGAVTPLKMGVLGPRFGGVDLS